MNISIRLLGRRAMNRWPCERISVSFLGQAPGGVFYSTEWKALTEFSIRKEHITYLSIGGVSSPRKDVIIPKGEIFEIYS